MYQQNQNTKIQIKNKVLPITIYNIDNFDKSIEGVKSSRAKQFL